IPTNASLFTVVTSYSSSIGDNFVRALNRDWITQGTLSLIYIGAVITGIAVASAAATACMSLGNAKLRRLGLIFSIFGSVAGIGGLSLLLSTARSMTASENADKIKAIVPQGILVFYVLFGLILAVSFALWKYSPPAAKTDKYEMDVKYRLFLMMLPFLALVAVFSYLPLMSWRFAFYDYDPSFEFKSENFVGLKWFRFLFESPANRADLFRALKNTFAMSGIGLATAWLPMVFAIFLNEVRANRPRKLVQVLTTIPNFISWVLVYSVAFAIFSAEGFLNWVLINLGTVETGTNHLINSDSIWLKMWLWNTWKGLGWSAIIYIAGISSIDPSLYEAAKADGAGRFKRMWHITVPGLMPTFFVLLILAVANVLSNGLEQYLVFQNSLNKSDIEVLDLFIYNYGIREGGNQMPLATVVGMFKSLISVTLLFSVNKLSKIIRGESVI
ncbi:MAG: ABC transporter permease subunit, partial [Oscillospiraceae bacterium]|nr:ABC transporter permease subunit [Oscillospiraceae bacterium]